MTREDLAKDILIALIPEFLRTALENLQPTDPSPTKGMAEMSVELADALLEALGAKEAPAPWLSKEMRTPAKGFPAIRTVEPWGTGVPSRVRVGTLVRVPKDYRLDGFPLVDVGTVTAFPEYGVALVMVETFSGGREVRIPTYRLQVAQ